MTQTIRAPIVGSKFYPPASDILQFLPLGVELFAIAEPDNPHDPNAIQVWIETKNIPQSTLDKLSKPGFGREQIPNLFNQSAWQLGHVAREFAAELKRLGFPNDDMKSISGAFTIGSDNGNRILLPSAY